MPVSIKTIATDTAAASAPCRAGHTSSRKAELPEQPIVIKAAGDGEAIFDGDGAYNLFNVMAANYNYFEGITIRNTDLAFQGGLKNIIGSSGLTDQALPV